ncbi:VPLPA-CTERM sorting domain-containing protein [uncultured Tateyamaria sp.]|uniref:VPLPA-CTERM sorting domain-containing protein n=1 Tax=uncultured Tateyamaria sp. TaxID=455651 RepID=UPI00260309D3|nr:VPLPA-CTERM sorting domain-containing protein [uncultured Tateyamaria sp.]
MRFLTALAVAFTFASGMAQAAPINGSDLAANPNIALPNGSASTVGTSIQFSGPPTNQVIVDASLSAFGFTSSGSITVDTTRVSGDSDFWIGLFDGTNFDSYGFWDGGRIGNYSSAHTSDGVTFAEVGAFAGATNIASSTAIGEQGIMTFSFDLIAGTTSLDVNGTTVSRNVLPGFNSAAPLRLLIGKGSTGETLQINSIDFVSTNPPAVPLPAGLPLLLTGIFAFGVMRRKMA